MNLNKSKPRRLFGVIKEFGTTYGFIEGQDGGKHFCHFLDLPAAWRPLPHRSQLINRAVIFELGERNGKKKAVKVFVIAEEDIDRVGVVDLEEAVV